MNAAQHRLPTALVFGLAFVFAATASACSSSPARVAEVEPHRSEAAADAGQTVLSSAAEPGHARSAASFGNAAASPGVEKHVLHFHGSNTLGVNIVPRLARAFLAERGGTEVIVNDESRSKERIWVQTRLQNPVREISIEIFAPGTNIGFESFEQGYCDLVMASRPVTDAEAKRLEKSVGGDLTAPTSEVVVGMDGIAVVVNPASPVTHLTTKQLADIFARKIKNWAEVGGPAGRIRVLARDDKSGTHDAFASLVMRGKPTNADQTFEDSEALADAVATQPGAIGYVGLAHVKQAKVLAIQDGIGRAIAPTPFTIATEDYPLSRRLFFYTLPTAKDPLTREFVEFTLSDAGQQLLAENGIVPLSLRAETAQSQVPGTAPARYAKLAEGATRLSMNFHFKGGTNTLDNKSLRDLERLVRHLRSPINRGRHVALAGFEGAQGSDDAAERLAKNHAQAVASLFAERGLGTVVGEVAGFGSALPIAPNDSPEGRARNRRVEVWLH